MTTSTLAFFGVVGLVAAFLPLVFLMGDISATVPVARRPLVVFTGVAST